MESDYGSKGSMVVNPICEEGPVWKGTQTHIYFSHHAKKSLKKVIKSYFAYI